MTQRKQVLPQEALENHIRSLNFQNVVGLAQTVCGDGYVGDFMKVTDSSALFERTVRSSGPEHRTGRTPKFLKKSEQSVVDLRTPTVRTFVDPPGGFLRLGRIVRVHSDIRAKLSNKNVNA